MDRRGIDRPKAPRPREHRPMNMGSLSWRACSPRDASLSIIGVEDKMTWSRPGSGDRREPRAFSRHLGASERAHRTQSLVLRPGTKDQAMEIEGTTFGTITIDGKTYEHDVIIRLSGEVVKRKKKLSKKYYGTSHVLSKDEAKFVFESGCEQLILGSGQMGNVHLSPE